MPSDRQAVSRLRARGPRRVSPPSLPEGSHDPPEGRWSPGGGWNRPPTGDHGSPIDPSDGAGGGEGVHHAGGDVDPGRGERPRGFTRRGRLKRTWFDRGPGYRIWAGGPVPRGASAWTLGKLVIVRRRRAYDAVLMAHEEEHVRQWAERGRVGFLVWYLRHYLLWRLRGYPHAAAYRRIPAEIEAEWRSRRRLGIGCSAPRARS